MNGLSEVVLAWLGFASFGKWKWKHFRMDEVKEDERKATKFQIIFHFILCE